MHIVIVGGQNLGDCRPGMVLVGSLITLGAVSRPFRDPRITDRDSAVDACRYRAFDVIGQKM